MIRAMALGVDVINTTSQLKGNSRTVTEQWTTQDRHLGYSVGQTGLLEKNDSGSQREPCQDSGSIEDHQIFQAVVDNLSVRSRHALAHGRVRNLHQFMDLRPDLIMDWPNTGSKTVSEIMSAQTRLRELENLRKTEGARLCADQICGVLDLPTEAIKKQNGQPVLLRRKALPTQVVRGADEPETWSVLKRTIPDLLPIDDQAVNKLLVTAGHEFIVDAMNLPDDDWWRLSAGAIYKDDQLDVIFFLSLGYLVELGISAQSLDMLASAVAAKAGCGRGDLHSRFTNLLSDLPIISEAEILPLRNLRIDSFDVPQEVLHTLASRGFVTWGDLVGVTERSITEASELPLCAVPIIRTMWRMKLLAQEAIGRISGLPSECFVGFEPMMQAYIGLAARNPRDRKLLERRLGLLQNHKWTLDELASLFGFTRERVRQIEQKLVKALKLPSNRRQLTRFWLAVDEVLRVSGGVCTFAELAERVAIKLEWATQPAGTPLVSLLQFRNDIQVDKQAELIYDPNHSCCKCEDIALSLESQFVEDKSERRIYRIIEGLLSACAQADKCPHLSQYLTMSEGFVRFVSRKTDGVLVEDGVVYCQDTWSSRRGSRVQLVESILKNAGQPMHFSEVYPEVKRLLPEDKRVTEHNVYSWLGRTDSILLWDRGTFVHRDCVSVPTDFVASVESWLIERLGDGVPFISVAGAYSAFENLCSTSGIASESALYSCLRKSANPQLCYPRYPQIYLSRNYESRIPAVVALEQYIESAQREVTYDALREYALNDLCLKEFQFQQFIYQLAGVVRTSTGGFLYLDSLSIGQKPESAEDYISSSPRIALEPEFAKMITDVMSAHFPNGFRINSPIELLRFRRFASEDSGDEIPVTDKELLESIASCGTFSDGKVYVISNGIESRIQHEVDTAFSGGAEIIFYNSFYTQHEEWLFAGSVISEGMLKNILVKVYPQYKHKANYFSPKAENGSELSKIKSEIKRVWGSDVILNYGQLTERLPYIPLDKIKSVLAQNSDFVWNATEVYTAVGKVDVTDEECAAIADHVAVACRSDGYASLSDVPLGEIGVRNYELTLTAIHTAVFEIVLADKYDRRGKIITRKGDTLDALTLMKEHCRTLDKCSLQDLLDFEEELTGESHRWIPMEAGYSVLVRADENHYIAEKYVHFDATRIDDTLELFVIGEYLPLKSITTFAAFPHCGQAWNLFLLESYCRRFSDRFRFEVLSVNSRNAGAIVRRSCRLSYFQIMADAVAESDIPLEKMAIVEFLYSSGYLGRRSYAKIDELIEQVKVLRESRN